ncbi:unnamed protein product [Camellia sinensis]
MSFGYCLCSFHGFYIVGSTETHGTFLIKFNNICHKDKAFVYCICHKDKTFCLLHRIGLGFDQILCAWAVPLFNFL